MTYVVYSGEGLYYVLVFEFIFLDEAHAAEHQHLNHNHTEEGHFKWK